MHIHIYYPTFNWTNEKMDKQIVCKIVGNGRKFVLLFLKTDFKMLLYSEIEAKLSLIS